MSCEREQRVAGSEDACVMSGRKHSRARGVCQDRATIQMNAKTVPLMLTCWMAATVLAGQTPQSVAPTPEEVRTLLESSVSKDQAWGAWWAATGHLRELEPQVRQDFEAHLNVKSVQDEMVLDATLDAFIQFGTDSVPVDELESLYPRRHVQALILLAEPTLPRAEVDRFLLTLVNQKDGAWSRMEWFAAANLLLSHHAPGLVAVVLRHLTFTENVVICDAGSSPEEAPVFDPGSTVCAPFPPAGYGVSWSGTSADPSFPPWAGYQWTNGWESPPPGATVLIEGPTTVAYARHLGGLGAPESDPRPPETAQCLAYVVAAAPQLRIPNLEEQRLTVIWRDEAAYRGVVEPFQAGIVQKYAAMIQQLRDAGLVSADDAAALAVPHVELRVADRRSKKTSL
jgi:hypothetical protein